MSILGTYFEPRSYILVIHIIFLSSEIQLIFTFEQKHLFYATQKGTPAQYITFYNNRFAYIIMRMDIIFKS